MYDPEQIDKIFDDICDLIINGKSLRYAIKQHNGLSSSTVFRWIREDEAKSKQYAQATIERAELIFEDIFDIADDSDGDYTQTEDGLRFNSEHVQRSRLRVDTRKWALSKMMPKKYGDKLDVTSGGDKVNQNLVDKLFPSMEDMDEAFNQ